MALIKCPECAHEVSDQAASCPQCGYPIQRTNGTIPASAGASELDSLVRRTLIEDGKIAAIKLYRERKPGSGLAAAKEYVERIEATVAPARKADCKTAGCFGLLVAAIACGALLSAIRVLNHAITDGVIKVHWDLTVDNGRPCTNKAYSSLFHITLPDSGRSQTLNGP